MIEADSDCGYSNTGEKRKVILWSKHPWSEYDEKSAAGLPSGSYVPGVSGGIRFIGVCIPWREADVKKGRKDRKLREDHLAYCRELRGIIEIGRCT